MLNAVRLMGPERTHGDVIAKGNNRSPRYSLPTCAAGKIFANLAGSIDTQPSDFSCMFA
jgi:hypothetical protein